MRPAGRVERTERLDHALGAAGDAADGAHRRVDDDHVAGGDAEAADAVYKPLVRKLHHRPAPWDGRRGSGFFYTPRS